MADAPAPPPPAATPGTMALSETSRAAQEKHAEVLFKLEVQKRAATMFVPVAVEKQKEMLRELGQPVTFFGEGIPERRDRLKALLAEREVRASMGGAPAVSLTTAAAAAPGVPAAAAAAVSIAQTEVFYTEASPELQAARQAIAVYSFQRASQRLAAEAEARGTAAGRERVDAAALRVLDGVRRARPAMSQPGDDRPLTACAVSNDGGLLATGSWGSQVKVWDANSGSGVAAGRGHTDRLCSVAWHPSASAGAGGLLASAAVDSTARLWRAPSIDEARAAGSGGAALSEARVLAGHATRLGCVAFHPAGAYVGTASFDRSFRLWDVETGTQLLLQEGHAREVYALAFHPDGSLAATGDLGGIGRVWDLRSGKAVFTMTGHAKQLLALDWSPNGYHCASGGDDNVVLVWDLRASKQAYTIPAHGGLVSRVRFAPRSGEYLATASYDGTVKLWSARNWMAVTTLAGHENKVSGLDISPSDETKLFSASFDRTFKVWEPTLL